MSSAPDDFLAWKINDKFAGGVADAMYAGAVGTLWVEYKYAPKLPARETTKLKYDIRPLQTQWLTRMHNWGHSVRMIVGCERRAVVLTSPPMWGEQITKAQFNNLPNYSYKQVAEYIEGKVI